MNEMVYFPIEGETAMAFLKREFWVNCKVVLVSSA